MSQGEEEEREMKHTLAFHAEGKNAEIHDYYQSTINGFRLVRIDLHAPL